MINDPFHPEDTIARERETTKRMLLGIVCAVAVTALLVVGYVVIRRLHAQQLQASLTPPPVTDSGPKGPAVAHIFVDQPSLERGSTTIGGVVKNISEKELSGLNVSLELLKRKGGGSEQRLVPVDPGTLQPQQEGSYVLKVSALEFGSIKIVGLQADPESKFVAFTTSPGKQRTPERLEPKVIIVKKPGKPGEFINTPDNPARVP
jgi:hypothetical protein